MMDMRRMYRILNYWFNETFGKDPDPMSIVVKLQEEVNELTMRVMILDQWDTKENRLAIQEEIADVTMVLFRLSQTYGLCYDNFVDAIVSKHQINRKRKWVEMPDGRWKHLPDEAIITYKKPDAWPPKGDWKEDVLNKEEDEK